ncbi:hypothetical protein ACLIIZ_03645 [Azonexus caeni]|jgi:hypothetical protein|uniref:hypothetical protein n=1 Tax=Azonexus caeni TaxID=266126 RepID=UPI003A853DE4
MELHERVAALEEQIRAMDEQLEKTCAEFFGFKMAFIRLCALLPINERDVTTARELAIAQAEDAMPPDGTPSDTALIALGSIHAVCDLAGAAWRQRKVD